MKRLRAIAMYLPQFHPIPENDRWWGKGFTEWHNVAKAKPRFPGHYQPHLPADLGFYDLRLDELRKLQVELAKNAGIFGFCYYHYWFHGKQLLEKPVKSLLANKSIDFPYCLCWANESWSKRWDGLDKEILQEQLYSKEDDLNHIHYLLDHFRDPRYIQIDGRPVILIYRTSDLPSPQETFICWRKEAQKQGINGLYIISVNSMSRHDDPKDYGADASMEFQPDFSRLPPRTIMHFIRRALSSLPIFRSFLPRDKVVSYAGYVDGIANALEPTYKHFPSVMPSWDNSARKRSDAVIFTGSTPSLYSKWLKLVCEKFSPYSSEENLIFINAWNEWAEGNHLEPCQKWGLGYIEATKDVLSKY